MSTPTAFISPRNYILDGTPTGWNGTGTIAISIASAMDGRVDSVARFIPNDPDSPTAGCGAYWTFGSVKPIQICALLNHNIPAGVDVICVLQDLSSTLLDYKVLTVQDDVDGYQRNLVFAFDAEHDVGIINFTIGASGTPLVNGDAVDVGEFWAGQLWTPESGIVFETPLGFTDPSLQAFSAGGQGFTAARNIYREVSMQFPALTEAEFLGGEDAGLSLKSIFGYAGGRRPVLIGPTRSSQFLLNTTAICGLMSANLKPSPVARKDGSRVWKASLDVRELR